MVPMPIRRSVHRPSLMLAAAAGLLVGPAATAQDTARGVVFNDVNTDGVRQAAERGIGGVAVSNGQQVVLTDAAGRYEIPVSDDTIVFVVKPRGYRTAMNEHGVPHFHYVHKPAGSPDDGFVYQGVAPTGPLPSSIDFGLVRQDETETFRVIAFGDPQPYSLEEVDFFRREVIDPLVVPGETGPDRNVHGAVFGISLGDLVGDRLDFFGPLNEGQGLLGVPWYNVYGNHDMNFLSGSSSATADDPDRWADETFERVYGPPNYAFQYGRVHFIVLDNVIYRGFNGYRDNPVAGWPNDQKPVTNNYRGGLRDDQLAFIDNYLDHVPNDDLVVLAFHVPIEGGGVHRIPEQERLFQILSSHPNTLSLSGHTHFQRHWFFGLEHGYAPRGSNQHSQRDGERFPNPVHHHLNAVTASGSWYRGGYDEYGMPHTQMRDGAPNGYTVLHFDGNSYRTEFRAARRGVDHQFGVTLPGAIDSRGGERTLTVNVFNGAEGDAVHYRIVPGTRVGGQAAEPMAWMEMDFTPGGDPTYIATLSRENAVPREARQGRTVPNPEQSFHLWSADLPGGLPGGTHVVEIRHVDLYGHERMTRRSFRVD